MRTTLNLSAEALEKLRQFARQRCNAIGALASRLILRALEPAGAPKVRNGAPLFPTDVRTDYEGTPPDLGVVNRLRDPER